MGVSLIPRLLLRRVILQVRSRLLSGRGGGFRAFMLIRVFIVIRIPALPLRLRRRLVRVRLISGRSRIVLRVSLVRMITAPSVAGAVLVRPLCRGAIVRGRHLWGYRGYPPIAVRVHGVGVFLYPLRALPPPQRKGFDSPHELWRFCAVK